MRTPRIARFAALAAATAIALAGCVRVTSDTSLHGDNTFSQDLVIAATDAAKQQAQQMLGMSFDDLAKQLRDSKGFKGLQATYPDKVTIKDFADGDLTGIEVVIDSVPLDEFNSGAASLSSALPIAASATVARDGDTFVVTMAANAAGDLAQGIDPSQAKLIEGSVNVGVSYTFPGLVKSATAGTVNGDTVTLSLSDLLTPNEIRIVGGATSQIDWGPLLKWGGIALAFVVVIGGAAALVIQDVRRRRHSGLPAPDAAHESSVGTIGGDVPPQVTGEPGSGSDPDVGGNPDGEASSRS